MPDEYALEVTDLTKTYQSGRETLVVLNDVSFAVPGGQVHAIVGPSGSGKTTLLGLCAGLENPTRGTVRLLDRNLSTMTEEERADLRGHHVGFVFQTFQLISTLTALENVMVPLELKKEAGAEARAREQLDRVGLGDRMQHYPAQLSGGEQQRVSIARAFAHDPQILFADEPTGNLDTETGRMVEDLLFQINREMGTTLVLVTHDERLAERTEHVYELRAGELERSRAVTQPT